MKHTIFRNILMQRELNQKMLAVLIDPNKCNGPKLASIIAALKVAPPHFVFVGGSHAVHTLENIIEIIQEEIDTTVVLFPGDASQFSDKADAILYLSLLSGRNPDYLIGQHIQSADLIHQSNVEVIPTAYLLIEGGRTSSVEYISNTRPIPRDKHDLVRSTALAGELLGMHMTYLEAGSGAYEPITPELVSTIKQSLNTPLIVGGGIRSIDVMKGIYDAGADIVVIGNNFEENKSEIIHYVNWVNNYNHNQVQPDDLEENLNTGTDTMEV